MTVVEAVPGDADAESAAGEDAEHAEEDDAGADDGSDADCIAAPAAVSFAAFNRDFKKTENSTVTSKKLGFCNVRALSITVTISNFGPKKDLLIL